MPDDVVAALSSLHVMTVLISMTISGGINAKVNCCIFKFSFMQGAFYLLPIERQFRGFGVEVGRNEDLLGLLLSPPLLLLLLLLPPLSNRPLLERSLRVKFRDADIYIPK